jgi:hypothetical protein
MSGWGRRWLEMREMREMGEVAILRASRPMARQCRSSTAISAQTLES